MIAFVKKPNSSARIESHEDYTIHSHVYSKCPPKTQKHKAQPTSTVHQDKTIESYGTKPNSYSVEAQLQLQLPK